MKLDLGYARSVALWFSSVGVQGIDGKVDGDFIVGDGQAPLDEMHEDEGFVGKVEAV